MSALGIANLVSTGRNHCQGKVWRRVHHHKCAISMLCSRYGVCTIMGILTAALPLSFKLACHVFQSAIALAKKGIAVEGCIVALVGQSCVW